LQFAVDDQEIGRITPPDGGFWEIGKFDSRNGTVDNPWIYGTKMAPFDKEVRCVILEHFVYKIHDLAKEVQSCNYNGSAIKD
jgi:hypothetical protein